MRKRFSDYGKTVLMAILAVVSTVLLIAAISMLSSYSEDLAVRAVSEAQIRTTEEKEKVYERLTDYTSRAVSMALLLSDCEDEYAVYNTVSDIRSKTEYRDVRMVRYFVGDTLYTDSGTEFTGTDAARAYRAAYPNTPGYIGVFDDNSSSEGTMSMIGFYAPVSADSFADAVVLYYPRQKLTTLFSTDDGGADAKFSVLALDNDKNEILVGGENLSTPSIKETLRLLSGDAERVNEVVRLIHEGVDGTVRMKIQAKRYVVSVCADREKMNDLAIVELYAEDILCANSLDLVDTILMIIILFAFIAVAVIVYLVLHSIRRKKAFYNMETTDTELQCPNRRGFETLAQKTLGRNNLVASDFFIIAMHLRHYKHIKDSFGEEETARLLSHLTTAISKMIGIEENYGHCYDGEFVLLLHARYREELIARLKTLAYLANQYRGTHKFDIILRFGIYEIDPAENITVPQAIDFATEANTLTHATVQNVSMQFNFYSKELREIRLMNEDMELRMEGALKDGEFQLFYQPKYNLQLGRQDGCEALVRWYDPKTKKFNPPALFMQLFETNGFIVRIDKYVYTKVCEYISYSIAHGGTVYPVSVNVSRITAVQPDFIDYYYKVKTKYGISDGLITIEFTESFAYEDYTTLRAIVDGLHDKGFHCSIDDFGCGYSSYRILKSLPMDEIKLDKFFLEKSDSEVRDEAIFKSIITLAKNLGMKVTQEGVETKEDLDRLIALGCDAVQGYYYSYPLPLSDYIVFVANTHEHDLIDKKDLTESLLGQ